MATKRKPTGKKSRPKTAGRKPVRKSTSRASTRNKPRRRIRSATIWVKPLLGLSILALLVLAMVVLADFFLTPLQPTRPVPEPTAEPAVQPEKQPAQRAALPPRYEVFPPDDTAPPPEPSPPATRPAPPEKTPPVSERPKVAIIIDDLGYDRKIAAKFLSLHVPLTFAVLPHSPFQKKIADMAHARGVQTMLHLPMEPDKYPSVNPGPGTLLSSMAPDELIAQLEENLDAVPHIQGVNNHMGSKLTAAADQINQVFSVLKQRGLYFVDSRTTRETVCRPAAKLFQLPFAQRDVFIDHFQEPEFIRKQLKELVRIAHRQGHAVGIAHPHQLTYRILKELLPEIHEEVQIVPASEIVARVG